MTSSRPGAKLRAATQVRLDDAQAAYLRHLAATSDGSVSAAIRRIISERVALAIERREPGWLQALEAMGDHDDPDAGELRADALQGEPPE